MKVPRQNSGSLIAGISLHGIMEVPHGRQKACNMRIQAGAYTICPVDEAEAEAILAVYRQCEDFLSICPILDADGVGRFEAFAR